MSEVKKQAFRSWKGNGNKSYPRTCKNFSSWNSSQHRPMSFMQFVPAVKEEIHHTSELVQFVPAVKEEEMHHISHFSLNAFSDSSARCFVTTVLTSFRIVRHRKQPQLQLDLANPSFPPLVVNSQRLVPAWNSGKTFGNWRDALANDRF